MFIRGKRLKGGGVYLNYYGIHFFNSGRYDLHKYKVVCDDCKHLNDPFQIEVLLASGFWPGSVVNINYLIQEEVFIVWDAFRKRMPGSSQGSFLNSLADIGREYGRVRKLI